jgi:hypothetical protein
MTGALVGLVACGAPSGDQAGAPAADTVAEMPEEPLASSLSVHVNDSVRFRLDLTNTTGAPLVLEFGSAQRFDIGVQDGAGEDVWRWSADRSFAQVLGADTLAAGETVSYDAEWAHGDRTGTFEATAQVTSSSHPIDLRTTFEVVRQ